MNTIEVHREIQKLEATLKLVNANSNPPELVGHWARYCCVLASGLLENAIAALYSKYAEKRSSIEVSNFTRSKLESIQNPKAEKFIQVARSFNPAWADELEIFLAKDGRKDAIDSIMNTRHHVAHGKTTGISIVRIKDYLRSSVEVLEFIERQLGL